MTLDVLDLEKIKNRTGLPLNTNCYIVTEKEFGVLEQALIQTEADKKKALKYDELTEQLGCPLEVVFKALNNGIYKENYDGSLEYYEVRGIEAVDLSILDNLAPYPECDDSAYYRDYKKTWWLKEDKSE